MNPWCHNPTDSIILDGEALPTWFCKSCQKIARGETRSLYRRDTSVLGQAER